MKRLFLMFALTLLACGGTGRSRRTFPVEVAPSAATATTDSGWQLTFTKATLEVSALRFFEGEVLISRAPWWRGLLIGTAHAHPGHYVPGEALGELVQPLTLDLLSGATTPWGTADAVTGQYGSAQVTLSGAGLTLEGTATKGDTTVPFSTHFAPPAALEGLRFSHLMTDAAGAVQLAVDLQVITSRMDFSRTGTSAAPLEETSPAFNGFGRGVEDTSAWGLTWKDAP